MGCFSSNAKDSAKVYKETLVLDNSKHHTEDYEIGQVIGQGAYGEVVKAIDRRSR